MRVREVRGGGAARVDVNDTHVAPRVFRSRNALIQHRMAPREVGPNQHDQVSLFQISVRARNRIRAKCTFMSGDR